MFFLLLSLICSKHFCFRPSEDFPDCPYKDFDYEISSIDELRDLVTKDDAEIDIAVSNAHNTTFEVDNNFQFDKPVKIYGVSPDAHITFEVKNDNIVDPSITLENISIDVKGHKKIPFFSELSLTNCHFDISDKLVFKAIDLRSDIASLQQTNNVIAKDVVLSFKNIGDKMKRVILYMYDYTSTIHFTDLRRNAVFHANEGSITFKYENELKAQLEIARTEEAKYIAAYMTIDNIKVDVESDSFLQYVTFDPTVKNGGIVNFHENTGCLSNNRYFTMEDGTATFKDNSYLYNLILAKGHSSKFVFTKSLAFNTISLTKHVLTIDNDMDAFLSCNSLTASLDSQINADSELSITGASLNLGEGADIRTSHVTIAFFEKVQLPSNTVKVQRFEGDHFNMTVPISFETSGLLQVDTFAMSKLEISLTHVPVPDEGKDKWEKLVGKEIPILTTTSASSSIKCDAIAIEIDESVDPWSSVALFSKQRIKFEKICTSTKVSIKLLENPANIYKKFIYANEDDNPYGGLTILNATSKWEDYVSKYTEGIQIMLHNTMPTSFDISSFAFTQPVELRFIKSPYTGSEASPSVSINVDKLKTSVTNLYFSDVSVNLLSAKGTPDINSDELTILGKTVINTQSYTVSSKKVTIQDKFIQGFKLADGMKLTVIPTDPRVTVDFTNDGWTFTGTSLGSVNVKSIVELSISTSCQSITFNLKEGTTDPHSLTLIHTGSPFITFSKSFETMKGMPPIVINTDDNQVRISTGASYLPISIVQPARIQFMGTLYPEMLTTALPAQKHFSGKSISFNVDETTVNQVTIPSFFLRDPPDESGKSEITSSAKIKFDEVRSLIDLDVEMTRINANKIVIDGTNNARLVEPSIKELRIQGELSYVEFPKVELVKVKNLESVYIDLDQPGAASIPSFSRPFITCSDSSIDLIELQNNITLSKKVVYVGTDPMYVSTTARSDNIYLILSPVPYIPPTSSSSSQTSLTPTPAGPAGQKGGSSATGIIVGSLVAIVVVVVAAIAVYYWLRKDKFILDSDYLSVSNDYMMKDALNP
jgi:hypothetical protein